MARSTAASLRAPITDKNDPRRARIRKYFGKTAFGVPIVLILAGLFMLSIQDIAFIGAVVGIVGGIWLVAQIISAASTPTDSKFDEWFDDDMGRLIQRSIGRLNMDMSQLIREPLLIRGPILWEVPGVSRRELLSKTGKDKSARYNVNNITVIHMTQHKLSVYQCDYNFMRGAPLNECDYEYFYKDVVSVASSVISTNYTLPNNHVMKRADAFSLGVASGDHITVIINSQDLVKFTGGVAPDTGLDVAVKALRKKISEEKIPQL